jgi:hypothetical protein
MQANHIRSHIHVVITRRLQNKQLCKSAAHSCHKDIKIANIYFHNLKYIRLCIG